MKFERAPAPHLRSDKRVARMMQQVLLALVPAAAVHVALFGPGFLIHATIAVITALACEYGVLRLRGREPTTVISDYSAVVMAVLLAFAIPPLAPWWVTVTGSAFAIIVAKQLFGGLGHNTFNPAMAGYVALLVSFPEAMTYWPIPNFGAGDVPGLGFSHAAMMILTGNAPSALPWDAVTMATPLDQVRTQLGMKQMLSEIMAADNLVGRNGWLIYQLAIVAGGAYLLLCKIIRWQIPLATAIGVVLCAMFLQLIDADSFVSPWFHLAVGNVMLCAFFIATDPVSAAASDRGRLLYGIGIGVLIVVIRSFGNFPDGVAFAVLLMNMCVPLIDHYFVPPAYGHKKRREDAL